MFRHILFPIDGEAPSIAATGPCVAFARDAGARLTVLHVTAPFHLLSTSAEVLADTPDSYAAHSLARARTRLETVAAEARAQQVVYETVTLEHAEPYQAIIDTARQRQCDLVAMASHGRSGLQAVLLGSVTQKVLAHCHLPVLVWR
ncbi:universal stress protein [Duganella sp. FT134W]|uniref:Universal stress protein n=1 Tax=Duganella margarita TaxID=2692170 RepID=A0A7X4H8G8_9BURK|nr:universal stress protein [Duganella margarita]MYM76262.1 universal stress protein [Duganella margarita]